ncbi:MAG: hypothetical protein WA635_13500 [Gallionella sp.]
MNRVADKNGMIARRATPVAATTRYWRSQPIAGVAACCHSRTSRFAHRVMAAVILRCQGAQHRERPFLSQPARALALRAVCVVRLRHVTAQQPIAGAAACNPLPHRTLSRTVSGVLLLAKGAVATRYWRSQPLAGATAGGHSRTNRFAHRVMAATIRVVAFLASHPARPNARPCWT